jgi:hypothetical protein
MISGRRDIGTATSVDQTSSPSRRSASMLHRDSLRADQSVFCSSALTANSKSPLLCAREMSLTSSIFSCTYYAVSSIPSNCTTRMAERTPALVPENLFAALSLYFYMISLPMTYLKNMVGNSFHFLVVDPALLITPICTSSMISIAATGTPARSTLDAAAAASRIVGNVTTATLVSWGTTASLRVISVTIPSVPSEPTKRFVRL